MSLEILNRAVSSHRSGSAWRPRLTAIALALGVLTFVAALFGPAVQNWDDSLREQAVSTAEQPITVLGVTMTMRYAKVEKRGVLRQPMVVFLIAVLSGAFTAVSIGLRSFAKGRQNLSAALAILAGGGAVVTTFILVPASWMFFLMLIPGMTAMVAAATFATGKPAAADLPPPAGLDAGGNGI